MLNAYAGKIAWVDLTRKSISVEPLDEALAKKYLGGKGLGAYLMYHHLAPHTPADAPENLLIFMTGPLTGTPFPAVARSAVITKSPLTGTICDSYSGSFFGPHLKYAGFDALVITGRAQKPCYLWVIDGEISFKEAGDLWGLSCAETEGRLKDALGQGSGGRISVAGIGPAGEKGVRFANIISAKRAYGRGGTGAVMGSKNLKAVAIGGRGKLALADSDRFKKIAQACRQKIAVHPVSGKNGSFPRVGTMHTVDLTQVSGTLPSRNWRENTTDHITTIGAEAFEKYIQRPKACFGCPIGCSRESKVEIAGKEILNEGPEYETIYAMGANCDIDDARYVIAANQICQDYGLDTISCGVTIGFAMECFQSGLITEKDTGGMKLAFGNGEALLETIHMIGKREGLGVLLGEGVKRASQKIDGARDLAVEVKGLELPGYDPRGMKGQGLTYALSDRGGCHLRSNTLRTELMGLPEPIDRYAYDKKAEMVRDLQLRLVLFNCVISCFFSTFAISPDDYAEALGAATGWEVSEAELKTIAERTWNLSRLFNMREGFRRKDDTLPERLFTLPSTKGPSKGQVMDRAGFEKMLDAYYEAAGWDRQSGVPSDEKLRELQLDPDHV